MARRRALAESTPFDLIWIELLLPDLNGYELLKRLKTLAVNGKPGTGRVNDQPL